MTGIRFQITDVGRVRIEYGESMMERTTEEREGR